MSDYDYSLDAPRDWHQRCDESNALFDSQTWQDLLARSFGCRTIYVWGDDVGAAFSIFSAGPFKLGYLGFPVGACLGDSLRIPALLDDIAGSSFRHKPVCIRIPSSAWAEPLKLDLPAVSNPETAIVDLPNWNLAAVSQNIRRNIRKSQKIGLVVDEYSNAGTGNELFEMYSATIRRHRGSLRYNASYFSGLVELAKKDSRLRVFLARAGDELAGFVVTARHRSTSYYLHGGTKTEYLRQSPSALLFSVGIRAAQQDGSTCFNFMASPPKQDSLVHYKEKWGGVTRTMSTYTLPLKRSYKLYCLAERLYKYLR